METGKRGNFSGRGLWASTATAATTFILLLFLPYILQYLPITDPEGFLRTALFFGFILSSAWAIIGILGRALEFLWPKDRSLARARSAWKVLSYVSWFSVFILLVIVFMGDIASTALGVGLLGAAFTFAMQKPLLNIAAWVVITYRQLYRIGDRVEVGGVKGYVVDIGLQTTELQEFGGWMPGDEYTGRIVTLPNGVVFDGATANYTRDYPFIWDNVEVLVTYESDIGAAKEMAISTANEVVGGMMYDHYETYRQNLAIRDLENSLLRTPEVRLAFADSGVKLSVVYFVAVEKRGAVKTRLVDKLWRRFVEDPRVELAYPHIQAVQPRPPKELRPLAPKTPEWMVAPGERR